MIQFKTSAKNFFFDRPLVMGMIDEAESKAFNRIGGRIRISAIRGMRPNKKGKSSPPGSPPRRHVGSGKGLAKIWYQYDRRNHRVVIGPLRFNWSAYTNYTVPQLHEFGGTVTLTEMDINKWPGSQPNWIRVSNKRAKRARQEGRLVRDRTATYPARPFMLPAMNNNREFIRDAWSGASVRVGG